MNIVGNVHHCTPLYCMNLQMFIPSIRSQGTPEQQVSRKTGGALQTLRGVMSAMLRGQLVLA
jgi:hypothetical protein